MNISKKGIDFIKEAEGTVLHAYKDAAGIPTIGIGCIRYKDGSPVKMGDVITMEEAEDLLKHELETKIRDINTLLGDTVVNQNQFDSIVSLVYNIGVGDISKMQRGFAGSTVLKRVKQNPNDPEIRNAFLMWTKITKNGIKVQSPGLFNRRKKEADLYFTPVADVPPAPEQPLPDIPMPNILKRTFIIERAGKKATIEVNIISSDSPTVEFLANEHFVGISLA